MSLTFQNRISQGDPVTLGLGLGLSIVICALFLRLRSKGSQLPYPPGPPPDPIIGNARDLLGDDKHESFRQWGKQWGGVCLAQVMGTNIIVINSFEVARDLLEKKSTIFSGRPPSVLMGEMMGMDAFFAFKQPGTQFNKHRGVAKEYFSQKSLKQFESVQMQEVLATLSNIRETPQSCIEHVQHFSASLILNITYGYRAQGLDDSIIRMVEDALESCLSRPLSAMMVDFVPIFKHWPTWLPFSGWKRHALATRLKVWRLMNDPFRYTKDQLAAGKGSISMASTLLETLAAAQARSSQLPNDVLDEEDIKAVSGQLYGAAAETTATFLVSFMLAMTMYPDVYSKIQAEIDENVGNRMLDFADRGTLPYFEATLKEVMRWTCPVPLGVPHRSTEDCVYKGMFIPRNSTVIANAWGITRDENVYPNPDKFDPERFVGNLDSEAAQQVDAVFGHGRRLCPGKWFAEANIWLMAGNLAAIFDISRPLDEAGNEIIPKGEFVTGTARRPKPFGTKVTFRSEGAKELLAHALLIHKE